MESDLGIILVATIKNYALDNQTLPIKIYEIHIEVKPSPEFLEFRGLMIWLSQRKQVSIIYFSFFKLSVFQGSMLLANSCLYFVSAHGHS